MTQRNNEVGDSLMVPMAEPGHALGPVASDWEAAEVWLSAVARKSRSGSSATMQTYGYHLAKLRWYCENICRVTPSRWSVQDVEAFFRFLEDLPESALCGHDGIRYALPDEVDYSPFRTRPAKSSQADIRRFVHAMFNAWNRMGYIRINPMGLTGVVSGRKVRTERSLSEEIVEIVLQTLGTIEVVAFADRQRQLRDLFILMAFRDLGLRASELVGAQMSAFYQLIDPSSKNRYWIFRVTEETAKGGRERKVPVTRALLNALTAYREAFGFSPLPPPADDTPLLLSSKTRQLAIGANRVRHVNDRRFFRAWQPITTRQGLYKIVKDRLALAAEYLRSHEQFELAEQLERASPHWLRHTFAKAALIKGQTMREVASLLGHASVDTTMIYTEQDALDLVHALERTSPDTVAVERLA